MMSNPGNAGQRYKMTRLVALEPRGNKVVHTVECGHNYEVAWESSDAAQKIAELMQDRIGKRQRCNRCQKEDNE